jgi:hypothetical protein
MTNKSKLSKEQAAPSGRTPWLLYVGVAALVLIIVGVALLWRQPTQTGSPKQVSGPRLAVDQEKIDFGQVPVEKLVKATFQVKNVGDAPLQILNQPQVRVVQGC